MYWATNDLLPFWRNKNYKIEIQREYHSRNEEGTLWPVTSVLLWCNSFKSGYNSQCKGTIRPHLNIPESAPVTNLVQQSRSSKRVYLNGCKRFFHRPNIKDTLFDLRISDPLVCEKKYYTLQLKGKIYKLKCLFLYSPTNILHTLFYIILFIRYIVKFLLQRCIRVC